MTSTGTTTATSTTTITRAAFLVKVVKYITKATVHSDSLERVIDKGILANQWIESVHIRALDASDKICAEIVLRVDWDRHRLHVKNGNREIQYDANKSPAENLSRKIDAIIDVYTEVVAEQKLRPDWAITYLEGIDRDHARQELGTSPSDRKWKDGTVSHVGGLNDKKLDELFADLSVVVQDDDNDVQRGLLRGVITGYFEQRGYGFVRPAQEVAQKDVFFHISNVVNRDRVIEGATVTFSLEQGAKGPRAVNVRVM